MKVFGLFIVLSILSCSPFSKLATTNEYFNENCPDSKNYSIRTVKNSEAGFSHVSYGDVKFANSKQEFKKLNPNEIPKFKKILFYGKTIPEEYEYYVLEEFKGKNTKSYFQKDTLIEGKSISILVSSGAPKSDVAYLFKNFYKYSTQLTEKECY